MSKKINLPEPYIYEGKKYGPGPTEVDDPKAAAYFEKRLKLAQTATVESFAEQSKALDAAIETDNEEQGKSTLLQMAHFFADMLEENDEAAAADALRRVAPKAINADRNTEEGDAETQDVFPPGTDFVPSPNVPPLPSTPPATPPASGQTPPPAGPVPSGELTITAGDPNSPLAPLVDESLWNLLTDAGLADSDAVQRASDKELLAINGIGDKKLEAIRAVIGKAEPKPNA